MDATGKNVDVVMPISMHDDHPPCPNCETPRFGPFCYRCGQPEKGLIRQFSSIMGDFFDTVFNFDSRTLRTVVPLFLRPGFLTTEYFAGRRTRYVTPVRLFVFLSILTFFAVRLSANPEENISVNNGRSLLRADNAEQLEEALQEALVEIDEGIKEIDKNLPAIAHDRVVEKLAEERAKIKKNADARREWLKQRDFARAQGKSEPPEPNDDGVNFNFSNDKPFDVNDNPIVIPFLTSGLNQALNLRVAHAAEVMNDPERGPKELVKSLFDVLPQVLFVLMPIFALLLKFLYLFKRRLYMEHLMVALHSHSFIFVAICFITIFAQIDFVFFGILNGLIGAWIPIYLFIMQKRVYRQGFLMTSFKFLVTSFCYFMLMMFGLIGATMFSILTL